RSAGGLGDAQLGVARRFGRDGGYTLRAAVKLPTGDEGILAGSGAIDWSLTVFRSRGWNAGRREAGFFWGVGAVVLGEPDRIDSDAATTGYVGSVGGAWQVGRRFGVQAQLHGHSELYASRLEEIGHTAIQATIGAWLELGPRATLDLGIVEDVAVSTS